MIGPGFPPIPSRTVSSIISGEYAEFGNLLRSPSSSQAAGPTISMDGRVVVSSAPKPARRVVNIVQWCQAFAIYALILTSSFPHRAADLMRYLLSILRTYTQFGGTAWLDYDEAFRRDAAARQISDWSAIHVELYNYHTAAAHSSAATRPALSFRESRGATQGSTIWRSWNSGRCVSFLPTCRYSYICEFPGCRGCHR